MWVRADYVAPCRTPRPERYDTHPFIPSKRLHELPHVMEALQKLIDHQKGARLRRAKARKSLSKNARRLLHAWALHPHTPVARLWDGLGRPSAAVQKGVREELARELAEFQEVRIGKRNMLFMRPTDAGWAYVKTDPPRRKGRGGIAHTHFCEFIWRVGSKRGYKAVSEWLVPGTNHPMDAVWLIDGAAHGFEVIVESRDNLVSHLEACFLRSDRVATLTVVATQKRIVKELEELLDREIQLMVYRPRIRFEEVDTFIKELWP
jgi:hypothetical protein